MASAPVPPSKYSPYLIAHLTPQHLVFDDLAGVQCLELGPGPRHEIKLNVVALADGFDFFVAFLLKLLQISRLGAVLLSSFDRFFEVLEPAIDSDLEFFVDGVNLFEVLGFKVGKRFVTAVFVDPADEMGGKVDDLFEHLGLELFLRLDASEEIGKP